MVFKIVVIAAGSTQGGAVDSDCSVCSVFFPSVLAGYLDTVFLCCYILLIALHCCGGRLSGSVLKRRRTCLPWLIFITAVDMLVSIGSFGYASGGDGIECVIVFTPMVYASLYAVMLYATFIQDSSAWHIREIQKPLLGDLSREVSRNSRNALLHLKFYLTRLNVTLAEYRDITLAGKIGSGGYAEVFKGEWKGVPIALKRLIKFNIHLTGGGWGGAGGGGAPGGWADDPESGERKGGGGAAGAAALNASVDEFLKEVGLMMRLRHPNVLAILGITATPTGSLCILTEYCERGSVFGMLHKRDQPWSLGDTLFVLQGTAKGMAYLHGLSPAIIHRDLKAQNLLVDESWTVKCADFGLSREVLTGAVTQIGTVQWAAPELLLGLKYTGKVDVWSFGVVAWECCARKVPFKGLSQLQIGRGVAYQGLRLRHPRGAPQELRDMMARCWHKSPEERPTFSELVPYLERLQRRLDAPRRTSSATSISSTPTSGSAREMSTGATSRTITDPGVPAPAVAPVSSGGGGGGSGLEMSASSQVDEFLIGTAGGSGDTPSAVADAWRAMQSEIDGRPPSFVVVTATSEHSAVDLRRALEQHSTPGVTCLVYTCHSATFTDDKPLATSGGSGGAAAGSGGGATDGDGDGDGGSSSSPSVGMCGIYDASGIYSVASAQVGDDANGRTAAVTASTAALTQLNTAAHAAGETGRRRIIAYVVVPDASFAGGCLQGVSETLGPGIPIVAATAACGGAIFTTAVVEEGGDDARCVAVALLSPTVRVVAAYVSGYAPTARRGVITGIRPGVIEAVSGAAAADTYMAWVAGSTAGEGVADLTAAVEAAHAKETKAGDDDDDDDDDDFAEAASEYPLGVERGMDPCGYPLQLTFTATGVCAGGGLRVSAAPLRRGERLTLYGAGDFAAVGRSLRMSLSSLLQAHGVRGRDITGAIAVIDSRLLATPGVRSTVSDVTAACPLLGGDATCVGGTFYTDAPGEGSGDMHAGHGDVMGGRYTRPCAGQGMVSMLLFCAPGAAAPAM